MICDNCATEIRKGWKFCPECGTEIAYSDVFIDLGSILKRITSEMERRGMVDMSSGTAGIKIDVMRAPRKTHANVSKAQKPSRCVLKSDMGTVEPKVVMKNFGDRFVVKVDLPGVIEEDIILTEQQESLEVRAHSKKTAYFKIIPVPQGFSQLNQCFRDGKLVLEFFN